jgi:hypothetical protein
MWRDGGGMWQKIPIFERCEINICSSEITGYGQPEHLVYAAKQGAQRLQSLKYASYG